MSIEPASALMLVVSVSTVPKSAPVVSFGWAGGTVLMATGTGGFPTFVGTGGVFLMATGMGCAIGLAGMTAL